MPKPDPKDLKGKAPVIATEKAKPIGYVNWAVLGADGKPVLRSNRGFSVFDNEHCTLEEKALIELAKQHGGTATVNATITIIVAKDKPTTIDVSAIPVIPKAAA